MPVPRMQSQDYTFRSATVSGWSWTTRLDTSGVAVQVFVRDVRTPYGILRDSVPLPGSVVEEMAESITQVLSAFAPAIGLQPTALVFTVDEGRGISEALPVQVSNDGVFGSLLSTYWTSSASYVQASPTTVGGLAAGEAALVQVTVDAGPLLSALSPYTSTITVQDDRATNSPQSVPVTVIVRPKAHIALSVPNLSFTAIKPLTGPFGPVASQTFQISNTGPITSVLDYQIQKLTNCSPWLVSFTPSEGQLAGGASQTITVSVVPPQSMLAGTYTETLRVTGYSDNTYQDLVVTLVIT